MRIGRGLRRCGRSLRCERMPPGHSMQLVTHVPGAGVQHGPRLLRRLCDGAGLRDGPRVPIERLCDASATRRSSRECSAMNQVCDPVTMRCADCATNADCAMGQYCSATTCHARICTPGATRCPDAQHIETCDSVGSHWTAAACATGMICSGTSCVAHVCVPGVMSCLSVSEVHVCNPDGLGFTTTPCSAGQSCGQGRASPRRARRA